MYDAETLWRKVVTEVGANHELGTAIWHYKLYHQHGDELTTECELKLRLMVNKINKERARQVILDF